MMAIGKTASARQLLASIPRPHDILVRDVGQASFASLRDRSKQELLHLDAGWPISYNLHTAGSVPSIGGKAAPVILSHWDWDHLHGYHVMPCLRQSIWISPVQRLGPGASLVANALAKRDCLYGVSISTLAAGPFIVGRCRGKRGNLNNTGLWARITLESGKSLLYIGDGEYDLVPLRHRVQPDFLVVTHHGAEFVGAIPAPTQAQNICIVSVGAKNTYGHPSSSAIGRHKAAGWHPSFTCQWGRRARGSRIVGP
jgi:competence protein ComEC